MLSFYEQLVQTLQLNVYATRIAFEKWYFQMCDTDPFFSFKVSVSVETFFRRERILYTHNTHVWAVQIPKTIRRRSAPTRFSVICFGRYYRFGFRVN